MNTIRLILALPVLAFCLVILAGMVYNLYLQDYDAFFIFWFVGLIVGVPIKMLYSKRDSFVG
jgi:hypothetical protein